MIVAVPSSGALCTSASFDRHTQGRNSTINRPAALQLYSWLQTDQHTASLGISFFYSKYVQFCDYYPECF